MWVSPTRLAVTLVTVPLTPETLIADGYGVAVPMSGAVIEVEFVNALVTEPIFPMVRKFVTIPKLFVPSCNWSTAMNVSPQMPFAVKVKFRLTEGPPAVSTP